jgi:hypothetical protein
MSQIQAGPSTEHAKSRKLAPGSSLQLDIFERISREHGRPLSSSSTNSRDRRRNCRRSQSIDGKEFSYGIIGAPNENQSPTNAFFSAEQLKSRKLRNYVRIWRRNFILTLGWFSFRLFDFGAKQQEQQMAAVFEAIHS